MASLLNYDRRRVNGPEKSAPPVYDDELDGPPQPGPSQRSGRDPSSIRPIFLQTGLITQANGSAYIEMQSTKIACAVYGPRQVKGAAYSERGTLDVQVKFAPFASSRRRAPMRDAEDRPLSVLIARALLPALRLELYPKAAIDIFVHVLEHDGPEACVAAATVAASTAVADAGVEMFGLVVGCSVARVGGESWIDPDAQETAAARGVLALACMPALNTLTNIWQAGELSLDEIDEMTDGCLARCADIHHVVVQVLLDSAKKRLGPS